MTAAYREHEEKEDDEDDEEDDGEALHSDTESYDSEMDDSDASSSMEYEPTTGAPGGMRTGAAASGLDLLHAFLAQIPQPQQQSAVIIDERTPQQHWHDFLKQLESSQTKVLKVSDACVETYGLDSRIDVMVSELVEAVMSARGLTHVILGDVVFAILKETGEQSRLLSTIFQVHQETLKYLRFGSDGSSAVIKTSSLLDSLSLGIDKLVVSELEFHGLRLRTLADVERLASILREMQDTLRQVNLFNLRVNASLTLDPIFIALVESPTLDELRFSVQSEEMRVLPLVSTQALAEMLLVKKKWWRLGLDGMGLKDEHCYMLAQMFSRDETCKVGDLLSLESNPWIGQDGYQELFRVFFNKKRMGLIKVDDKQWETKFDLVRSMNNLHGRLDYIQDGSFQSRDKWVEWLAKLGNLDWEDDKHKLNYIWFSILEKPNFVVG